MVLRILFFWSILCFSLPNVAQTCCSGGVPLSNNIGLPILEKGTIQVGLFYDYNNLNTLNRGSEILDDSNRLRTTHSVLLNLGYSITSRLSVETLLTWVNQQRRILSNNNIDESFGIGDAIILARYRLLEFKNWNYSIGGGVKLPLGATDRENNLGITLNADLQPGSNTYDAILMSSIGTYFNFRKSLNLTMRYTFRATGVNTSYLGDNDYKFGNEQQFFFIISDQFLLFKELFESSLQLKYRNANRDVLNDNDIINTGGDWFFIRPTITYNLSKSFHVNSSVEVPLYSNVDGIQLTPTYRLNVGLTFRFLKKRKSNNNLIY
ncbi:hypothetical protein SAMN04489761_4206 [Tenacibaculum sp. MAR_2009_124]|uniref:transporter n=1 Tax=Tenacibaculum sp. MAR_2009_124 TaxID=1250059 RepID=UPI00089B63C4|nr:transporter [Tenacibaculum sp. MAR_2009_124]SED07985.1 hypothetical protein SAMN04489761_4206 [Tenacibaculum sp. MAR_2009_124]